MTLKWLNFIISHSLSCLFTLPTHGIGNLHPLATAVWRTAVEHLLIGVGIPLRTLTRLTEIISQGVLVGHEHVFNLEVLHRSLVFNCCQENHILIHICIWALENENAYNVCMPQIISTPSINLINAKNAIFRVV